MQQYSLVRACVLCYCISQDLSPLTTSVRQAQACNLLFQTDRMSGTSKEVVVTLARCLEWLCRRVRVGFPSCDLAFPVKS